MKYLFSIEICLGLFLILLCGGNVVNGKSLVGEAKDKFAKKYLSKFGYFHNFNVNAPLQSESIKRFQAFAGIPVTGKIDEDTVQKMQQPRCQQSDPVDAFVKSYGKKFGLKITINLSRKRRYILQGTNWKKTFAQKENNVLRWTLRNSGRSLKFDVVQKVMEDAFQMWESVSNVHFEQVPKEKFGTAGNEEKDIEILVSFETYYHNDGHPFDGQGGVLAHAFYPGSNQGFAGDVHFDNDETFTYKDAKGTDIMWVAVHEIGHSLGLEHTHINGAIMYPYYSGYKPDFQLHQDDITGIQNLYGSRSQITTTTTTTTTTTPQPVISAPKGSCPSGSSQITALYHSHAYKQIVAMTSTDRLLFLGYKRYIPSAPSSRYFPNSGKVDAAFELRALGKMKKMTVIFSGPSYYIYNEFRKVSGPHSIHAGSWPLYLKFPQNVKQIDAAMVWMGSGRVYFFAGTKYYRYNFQKRQVDPFYPKTIKYGWRGLPERVDAAYSSPTDEKLTIIIRRDTYYVYDTRNIRVTKTGRIGELLQCSL